MGIKDRDLGIIGAGAFLTVLCLLFNWPFVIRVVVGLLILVIFMLVALMRFGPDRIPLEEVIARRLERSSKPRRYSYRGQQPGQESAAPTGTVFTQPASVLINPLPVNIAPKAGRQWVPVSRSIAFAWEEVGIYRLVTICLAVIGVYFIYWLTQGGTQELGRWMSSMFRVP
jgi:hypothetical protein